MGRRSKPLDLPGTTMAGYAADVFELMTHLDMPDAVIGGLSMGGYVAFAMWRQAPARVSGLVLADTRATADSDEARAGRERMLALLDAEGPGRRRAPDGPEAPQRHDAARSAGPGRER